MTVLEACTEITAPPARVWELLGTLDALERYDPGVYRLRFGPLGVVMDAALVRRRWRAGIDSFMRGLEQLAERGPDTVGT